MAKRLPADDLDAPAPLLGEVRNAATRTTPDNERGDVLEEPNIVTALLLYGTDSISLLPTTVKQITMGSAPGQGIVIPSPYVSARHCRLERKGESLKVTDLRSKNGTYFEGERARSFVVRPGNTFIVGARSHRYLALNDQMRASYPVLADVLGAENEHVIGAARETPSPSDVIVAAVGGAPIVVTADPHCEQERLARIIHEISRLRERAIVELPVRDVPTDRKAQDELIRQRAARSTLVLDLGDHDRPIDLVFASKLFRPRHQVRVVVLAHNLTVVDKALGREYLGKLQEIGLRPLVSRPEALDRLFDRMLEERNSPLRMSYLTPENQEAIRRHDWPDNFRSLRQAATWLTAIYRLGTVPQAAQALQVASSTLYTWYQRTLKLSLPLSNRLIRRDNQS
jgi:pSer/pThr/pTyr-binding forkhead associated (FHA) protein